MKTTTIEKIQKEKGSPCISIIMPTHKTSPERTVDRIELKKILNKAEELIKGKFGQDGNSSLLKELRSLTDTIDYVHNNKGVGVFASKSVSEIIKFPFEVKEKIVVGETFELKDILYLQESLAPYYVLFISGKKVKLYSGKGEKLEEVKDGNFPSDFYDDYEYSKPSLGSSYGNSLKSTEKDKSIVKEKRFMAHLKKTDHKLSGYAANNTPFILCGNPKDLGYFLKSYSNHINIAGKIHADHSHESLDVLAGLAYKKINYYFGREQNKLIKQLTEAIGKKLAVTGIRKVWKAAKEGRGLTLLIEKDFKWPGFTRKDSSELFMKPPVENHDILQDATETIIRDVLSKKGKVVIVDNRKLEKFDKIAMLLRY